MSKHDPPFKPLSLSQHFEAPEDFVGCFGWLCGYSADGGFLDDAVERFTRRTQAQRAYCGCIAMALMLDPSNEQITPTEVPGVLHVPMNDKRPFSLLHAKVALLGFRHTSDARKWQLRLIVSTGNWTRGTLEDSLDLVWRIDLSNDDLKVRDDWVPQACADIKAAWKMLDWLRSHFDLRVLNALLTGRSDSESTVASRQLETWIEKTIKVGSGVVPRFFDNRQASLLAQLPDLVREHSSGTARNYIGMGSGFFESSDNHKEIPSVLKRIVDSLQVDNLQKAKLLTSQPEIDVFVNPTACQAVANSVTAFGDAGWKVREAGKPDYFKAAFRSLHAKFIFSANQRDNSNLCNSAWLYLGSGNLTGPGFANKMNPQLGNLEAGILFAPESLHWETGRGVPPDHVVTNVLPLQWESDFCQSPGSLDVGNDMPEPELRYSAAPAAYLFWVVEENVGWLRVVDGVTESFDVLAESGLACPQDSVQGFQWPGTSPRQPRQVQLRWLVDGQEQKAWVPVLDEFGRVAATTLPRIDIEEAWGQLANFPMPPDDEELIPDGDDESAIGAVQPSTGVAATASYPVRQVMQLIENIAAKQTSVSQVDWPTWCTRFEQCLIQAAGSKVLGEFLKLGLNPLSPLWCSPFRPDFAMTAETSEGLRYEEALKRVETAWNVAGLTKFGDQP